MKRFLVEAISGLSNNLEKNETILVSEVPSVKEQAFLLGCRLRKLPSTYLGPNRMLLSNLLHAGCCGGEVP